MLYFNDDPTPESIAQAKHAMWEERAAAERKSPGLRLTDKRPEWVMACPYTGCCFSTKPRLTQGKALRSLIGHIVAVHRKES